MSLQRHHLHFDPAVHRLKHFSVVDGMDLDQECQTLAHCRGEVSAEVKTP